MTKDEALVEHDRCLGETRAMRRQLLPGEWAGMTRPDPQDWGNAWVFAYRDEAPPLGPFEAVVVPKDGGEACIVSGAIGKVFRQERGVLGLPRSTERWLGSGPGRYQLFEKGLGVWDEGADAGYRRPARWLSRSPSQRCAAAVAFMDLRGFTEWTKNERQASTVQDLMARLESLLQDAFSQGMWELVFLKGVGDGAMVVCELEWYRGSPPGPKAHVCEFLKACVGYVRKASSVVPSELGVGCGIEYGEVFRTFLFGQTDYLGALLNSASKLQSLAWNDVVLGPSVLQVVSVRDAECFGLVKGMKLLGERGARIDVVGLGGP